jgi:hypothetical protein
VATPFPLLYFGILNTTTRVLSDKYLTCSVTCSVILFWYFETIPFLLFVVGWPFFVFGFWCTLCFAVFHLTHEFNQDMSKFYTGAVTNMGGSKWILSLSLSVATVPSVVVWC